MALDTPTLPPAENSNLPSTPYPLPPAPTTSSKPTAPAPQWINLATLEEAQSKVSFPLLVPDEKTLPSDMIFAGAQYLDSLDQEAVVLIYLNNQQELDIQQVRLYGNVSEPNQPHARVKLRGTTGYLFTSTKSVQSGLLWDENGHMIALGGGFSPDDLIRIAEGLVQYTPVK